MNGRLATGEHMEIREGTVELTINGATYGLGGGGLGFVRSNEEHRIRNAGTGLGADRR
jgi:mannose-6-phosphate isomerase-like protein (cupin superfamily)